MMIETNMSTNIYNKFDNYEQEEAYLKYKMVVLKYDSNYSLQKIADELGKSKSQVQKVLEKFKNFANVHYNNYSNCGRKKILSEDEIKNFILNIIKENDYITQQELCGFVEEKFGLKVTQQTISNFLKNFGVYCNSKLEIPILSDKNKIKRIEFARYHLSRNDKFSNVVFSDESRFQMFTNTRKVFVRKGESRPFIGKPNPNYSIMVWGAICRKGKVAFKILDGTMNSEEYLKVLNDHLITGASKIFKGARWRFQQDNAPCHKSYLVKEWLSENVPVTLSHPPQSPDLNPIEMIWAWMKKIVEKSRPKTKTQLKEAIENAWENVPTNMINNCIDHLDKVMNYIINNNGNFFK